MSRVFPDSKGDDEDFDRDSEVSEPTSATKSKNWIKQHPWLFAAIVLLVLGCIVTAVVVPVCVIHGCPAKEDTSSVQLDFPDGVPRLIVHFTDELIDAMDIIPAILHQYIENLRLDTSNLQILDFIDEDTLQEARTYLEDETSLDLLTRDFLMSRSPVDITSYSSSDLIDAINSLGRRSLEETLLSKEELEPEARHLAATPVNDPFVSNGSAYHINTISAPGAWDTTIGTSEIIVAIIDTGADLSHPDLAGNLWINVAEIPGNGIDDDGNGFVDDVNGWDFNGGCKERNSRGACTSCQPRADPVPDDGHGTHVAGLVAAIQGNGIGVSGVAPNVKLMILRVSDCKDGAMYASSVHAAFDYALKMGAHIVSCSFGTSHNYGFKAEGPAPSYHASWKEAYDLAIAPLEAADVLVVAAAGNEAIDLDALDYWGWAYLPCLVNRRNVLCVGATDKSNHVTFFANWGTSTVDLGAPGFNVWSTYWQPNAETALTHTYKQLNGSSMSTPIVSGVAALALSVLGATDGDYRQARAVKDILLASASKPIGVTLPFITGSVVNAQAAVRMATQSIETGLLTLDPVYSGDEVLPHPITFQGFSETYHRAVGNQFSQDISGAVVSSSTRTGLSSTQFSVVSGFKFGSGYVVRMRALMKFESPGINTLLLQSDGDARSFGMYLNGQQVPVDSSTKHAVFTISQTGWYNFELRIAYPSARLDLKLLAPRSRAFTYVDNFRATSSMNAYSWPEYTLVAPLSNSWQVFYNKTTASGITTASFEGLGSMSTFQYTTSLSSLALVAGALQQALFPGDTSTSTAALGYATSMLKPNAWGDGVQFKAICKGCQVLINGMVVLDVYESLNTPLSLQKISPCLKLASNQPLELTVHFANNPLKQAAMVVTYTTTCGSDSWRSLDNMVETRTLWNPTATVNSGTAGYIGGLQCDIWYSGSRQKTATIPQGREPSYKVRLPNACGDKDRIGTPASQCSKKFSFKATDIFPGLSTAVGTTVSVRCWTFVSNKFDSLSGSMTRAYLGGRQVFGSTTKAPGRANTKLGDFRQQFVVEWDDMKPAAALTVLDGGSAATIDLASMLLPITPIANSGGFDPYGKQIATSWPVGTFSTTMLSLDNDIEGLVNYNLAPNADAMPKPLPQVADAWGGLDKSYNYPSRSLTGALRYTLAEGFYWPPNYSPQPYIIKVEDPQGQSTMVIMGNVTVLNPASFSASKAAEARTFQVFLPYLVNVYSKVIVKSQRPGSDTQFSFTTLQTPSSIDPGAMPDAPWDSWTWSATYEQGCSSRLAVC